MNQLLLLASIVSLILTSLVQADVASGPAVGSAVKPLEVHAVTGDKAGEELDYAAERADRPTVYVFVNAKLFDRPAGRFLRKLDDAVKAHNGKAAVVAVWLTDDKDAAVMRVTAIQKSLQLTATSFAVFPSLTDLPDGWALNTDAAVTAVVAAGDKISANFAYVSVNETVVGEVADKLSDAIK